MSIDVVVLVLAGLVVINLILLIALVSLIREDRARQAVGSDAARAAGASPDGARGSSTGHPSGSV
ncbi:MAG TPA: hypothetical protein VKR24_12570 [Candidatus Limnocylindrales bacterium]|nr:hypothetical protein [Candidatus Limnocylindrales bacterium]